ncbi:MAG: esterase-like activity of phytase family protein [Sulfurovum sp.]
MKVIFLLLYFLSTLDAEVFNTDIAPFVKSKQFGSIRLLDQKRLDYKAIAGTKFSEISDLSYEQKSKKLYFVGDEGKLFVFDASFGKKIDKLEPLGSVRLTKGNGEAFASWQRDSEGLALNRKNELCISFEGRAKISRFGENGRMIDSYPLPLRLRDPQNYRSRNKSLEALAWHPRYGLLTVAEWPLKQSESKVQTVYALQGKTWHFKAEAEPKSAVVAIEVMDDGNLLVMERSFTALFEPLVVTLKKVYLNDCTAKQSLCRTEVLLKMDSHKGWMIDNFEGLARVSSHRYVIVSDDNDNFFQQTLLVYFEISK